VKKIKTDGSKTIYVGGIYEVDKTSGGSVTGTKTYYPAAGAMRVGSTLYYVLKDHLGSASVVTNTSGTIVGEDRFYPFGETRFTTGTMFTDKLFTGQREITGLGIYHYGARFYSPKLGRFLSADTVVPVFANPQSLNRFSYTVNNPIRYNDPDGHCAPACLLPLALPVPLLLAAVAVVAVTVIFYATVPPPAVEMSGKNTPPLAGSARRGPAMHPDTPIQRGVPGVTPPAIP
jgi:RHS repeat-associated protein